MLSRAIGARILRLLVVSIGLLQRLTDRYLGWGILYLHRSANHARKLLHLLDGVLCVLSFQIPYSSRSIKSEAYSLQVLLNVK